MMNETPLVSILCTAYNHEAFIQDALQGFVVQQTNFPFEIIVHDDASTDKTVNIIREYEEKYPNLFFNIYQTENQYSKGNGDVGTIIFGAARGKYVSLCEGDDYWTDPLKLQKQVDFMEANEDFAICFHPVKIWQNGKIKDDYLTGKVNDVTTIFDLANGNYIHTPSVLYRNNLFEQFPPEFAQSPVGDYFLHMLNARFGKIKKLPDVMAVYRLHESNNWANTDVTTLLPKWLKTLELMQPCFNVEIKQLLLTQYANLAFELATKLAASKSMSEAGIYLQKSINSDLMVATNRIIALQNTKDYKIGHFILRPFRYIKHICLKFQ